LFNLGDPAARRWMSDFLSERIAEFGVDIYRNDFNIDPLPFWRAADKAGDQGFTETAYVSGVYAMWDDLLARHPGLVIDNCAGGGRRIDLETCSRSVPFWHSDTGCSPGHADWNQAHIFGLGQYVPLFGACAWEPTAYEVRSAATAGLICQFAVLDRDFDAGLARKALTEAKANQKYWYGDFFPLAVAGAGPAVLCAYQLHRSDLDSGILLAFRRSECPFSALQASLHGLKPAAKYTVTIVDEAFAEGERTMSGTDLMEQFELRLPKKNTSLLVRYRPAK
jgi:alpha-galactosidase